MTKSEPDGAPAARVRDPSDPSSMGFAFDGPSDGWMEQLRDAEAPLGLGQIGDYELIDEINRGGQGVVYRARQPGTKRLIALKRPVAGSFTSNSTRLRFEREIESAAALSHPNIVTAYGMEIVDGTPLLAMEWIDGVTATQWAAGLTPLPGDPGDPDAGARLPGRLEEPEDLRRDPRAIIEVFLRICDAIAHAHSRGILHRDLKPSNILVTRDGQPHVLDFGLAKRFDRPEELAGADENITQSADFLGTPAYASPEQFSPGRSRLDERTDIYALGVLLYEMLTGRSPYPDPSNVIELIRAVETFDPPRLSGIDPRLGRELDTIVLKAMSKDAAARYASVDTLASDLRRYLAGEPISAVEPSSWYLLRKVVTRNRLAFAFAATVLALVLGFGLNAIRLTDRLRQERDDATTMKNQFYQDKVQLAEQADRLEKLLFLVTERDAEADFGGLLSSLRASMSGGEGSSPCADELLGTRNPFFDPDDFAASRRPLDPGGPVHASLEVEGP